MMAEATAVQEEQALDHAEIEQAAAQMAGDEPAQTADLDSIIDATERRRKESLLNEVERFTFHQRLAKMFAMSGMFGSDKKLTPGEAIARALVRIQLGESMGFTAAESMQGIDVISNRAAVSAALRASRMQQAGYSWTIDHLRDAKGEPCGCRIWLYHRGKPLTQYVRDEHGNILTDADGKQRRHHISVSYMREDAQRMKTTIWVDNTKKSVSILEKDNWKNSPTEMYFARAITRAQRWYAPGALNGVNLPSFEEAMDLEPLEITPIPAEALEERQPKTDGLRAKMAQSKGAPTLDDLPFDAGA